jgi:hypothetical protein
VADVAVIFLPLLIVYQINFLCASVIKYEVLPFLSNIRADQKKSTQISAKAKPYKNFQKFTNKKS